MLRVLGRMRVGDAEPRFRSRRAAELLGMLAIGPPDGLRRTEAAATLWPEVESERAAHNLRQTLVYLREGLAESDSVLHVGREHLAIRGEVDAREFLRLVRGGEATWPAAAALDTGELLPGIEGEWAERARAAHGAARLTLLLGLSASRLGEDPAEALELAQRAIRADPLLERARRAAIEALVALGERGRAVEEFATYDRRLRSELGLAASPLLRELAFGENADEVSPDGSEPLLSPGARLSVAIGTAPRYEVSERYRAGIAALRWRKTVAARA